MTMYDIYRICGKCFEEKRIARFASLADAKTYFATVPTDGDRLQLRDWDEEVLASRPPKETDL